MDLINRKASEELSINALHQAKPLDEFNFSDKMEPLNLAVDQKQDKNFCSVIECLKTNRFPTALTNLNPELRNYRKHLKWLEIQNGVFYRNIFDDTGRNFKRQYVLPIQLRGKVLLGTHHSKFAGHLSITSTAHKFRKLLYFPTSWNTSQIITKIARHVYKSNQWGTHQLGHHFNW